jgi:V/A-type H+-transporting ATPase subunit I
MSLRPASANWFELLVMRDDLAEAMKVLASSRRIELQSHGETKAPMLMPECRELLEEFDELERRYRHHWPAPAPHEPDERDEPYNMLRDALGRLRDWAADAPNVVGRLERLTERSNDQELLLEMLQEAESLPDLEQFSRAGPMLESGLFLLGSGDWPDSTSGTVIIQRVAVPAHRFLMAVGLPEEMSALEQQLHAQKARRLSLPPDLPPKAKDAEMVMQDRLLETRRQLEDARQALRNLHQRCDVADALADALFVRWYVNSVPELSATENFAWVSGWTSDADGDELQSLLAEGGVKGLMQLTEAPPGYEAPLLLKNPRWMRPFEIFTEMLGVPSAGAADPTRVVAIATPLMFGYMFGDVGHGAVLLAAGFLLQRRFPALRLLIYGGVMSILFGFAFGSVFTLETVIRPLWIHPLEKPVVMLFVPMAAGAVLLLLGMCLDALQAHWQRKGRYWWETAAGFVLCYLALLGSMREPRLLWLALAGALWFVAGHALVSAGRRFAAAGGAAVEFLESMLQLIVNTISFVRVGAFALAHAGLSMAVVGLAYASRSIFFTAIILVLGNVLIIALEGLVVSVQTTRLVLFEFFVRFLHAEGRPFRPLAPLFTTPPPRHRRQQ